MEVNEGKSGGHNRLGLRYHEVWCDRLKFQAPFLLYGISVNLASPW